MADRCVDFPSLARELDRESGDRGLSLNSVGPPMHHAPVDVRPIPQQEPKVRATLIHDTSGAFSFGGHFYLIREIIDL